MLLSALVLQPNNQECDTPEFIPLSLDRINDRYKSYWGMVSTGGSGPNVLVAGNIVRISEEVPGIRRLLLHTNPASFCQDSLLFTDLAFVVAITELCEYTIKIIVDPMIRPERRTLHE